MNDNSKLTVIVPCYNVAAYMRDCLDSIRNQSYANLSVILIDDGSTDETGQICEEYAAIDNRFKVIHQKNKGSSIARQIGVKHSHTEYVTFVDSDDVIHPDMYWYLMTELLENDDADIIVCGVADMYGEEIKHRQTDIISSCYEKVNHIDGVLRISDDTVWQSYMTNKIFRRSLFENIEFPVGRNLDEDTSVMHLIFHNARMSLFNPSEFYYYWHHEGSICLAFSLQSMVKKSLDRIGARWERLQFVEAHPEYHSALNKQRNNYLAVGLAVMRIVAKYPQAFPCGFYEEHRKRIKQVIPDSYSEDVFNMRKQGELFVLRNFPFLFKLVYKILPAW